MRRNGEIDVTCSVEVDKFDDAQKKVWNEALFKSKGMANTRFGANLVRLGATADEVVKFTAKIADYPAFSKTRNEKMTAIDRAIDQVWRSVPDFWETVKGRKMKDENSDLLVKVGLNPSVKIPITKLDVKLSQYFINKTYKITGETYLHHRLQYDLQADARMTRALSRVTVFKPLANTKFKDNDGRSSSPIEYLMERTASPNDWKMKGFDEYRDYEIDSFANMDESITSEIKPIQLLCDCINENGCWRIKNYPNSNKAIQLGCIIEAFYDVCKEIGIVGILDEAVDGRSWCSEATCSGIMKHVIKMAGTYHRLVKGGFAESVARETVLTEINDSIVRRASRPSVRFYPRNDYADTPEEERVKVKKDSGSGGGSSRNKVEEFSSIEELLNSFKGGEDE